MNTITLQSHREAIAKKDAEAAELRAALVGCVEALNIARIYSHCMDKIDAKSIDAAITQAQGQIK